MNNDSKYMYDNNYVNEANFTRLKKGSDLPLLETEINDIQIIQEKTRTSLVRRLVPSGFIELIQKEFSGDGIIYNPIDSSTFLLKTNHIAIAPSRVFINGYEINIEGNFSCNGYNNYTLVELGEAPLSGDREDLIYLELWQQNIKGDNAIKKWGYQDGINLDYTIVDSRVNEETSRRIMWCWNIRVAKDINFSKFKDGLGYTNSGIFSNVKAVVDGTINNPLDPTTYIFANAASELFKTCDFYQDHNLYVAGRPNYNLNSTIVHNNYVFALPLFRVKRRNKQSYSIHNPNGSIKSTDIIGINSSVNSDLNSNIRPDRLYYDHVSSKDIVDLRRSINTKELYGDYYLDKSLKQLFNGELQTHSPIKMRRAQFGNIRPDYNNEYIVLVSKFNGSIEPEIISGNSPSFTSDNNDFIYKDSVAGYGLLIDGNNTVTYDVDDLTMNQGTIDFFCKPDWQGTQILNQTIFNLKDSADRTVMEFSKQGNILSLKYFYDSTSYNITQVNLNTHLMFAKNIYHIRVSWNNNPNINSVFIYLNGKLCGQQNFSNSSLIPTNITVGKLETIEHGFVIEDLILYNCSFEFLAVTDSGTNIVNEFWDNLSKDIRKNDAIIYPSFNSTMRNFSDNPSIQHDTIETLELDSIGVYTLDLSAPKGKIISNNTQPIVYHSNGNIIIGSWSNLGTDLATFTSLELMTNVIVQYSMQIPGGNGGQDVPIDILSAGLIEENNITEVSFNKIGASPRNANFLQPRRVNGQTDYGLDYCLDREQGECFARKLFYYVNGNGTNEYEIPLSLYGYTVLGIISVTNQKVINIFKDTNNNNLFVELDNDILIGETLEFEISLGGMTFDYDIYSKNLVNNIHKTVILEIVGNGTDYDYVIPCFSDVKGGVLKSVFSFKDNIFDNSGSYVETNTHNVCYINGNTHIDITSNGVTIKELCNFSILNDSFGTPFLRIRFTRKPRSGDIIQIPVLVSYQPSESEILSLWYNYIPYQGRLDSSLQKFKRISQWKHFITTYSSGNEEFIPDPNIYSFNNIINRLPGGLSYAYEINGDDIKLKHLYDTLNKNNINSKLLFINDVFFNNSISSNSFFNLDTDLIIYKTAGGYQDGKVIIQDKDFSVFMPDNQDEIKKYLGMTCLVINEYGEVMLLVLGYLNKELSQENELIPIYGDAFRIQDIPTTIPKF